MMSSWRNVNEHSDTKELSNIKCTKLLLLGEHLILKWLHCHFKLSTSKETSTYHPMLQFKQYSTLTKSRSQYHTTKSKPKQKNTVDVIDCITRKMGRWEKGEEGQGVGGGGRRVDWNTRIWGNLVRLWMKYKSRYVQWAIFAQLQLTFNTYCRPKNTTSGNLPPRHSKYENTCSVPWGYWKWCVIWKKKKKEKKKEDDNCLILSCPGTLPNVTGEYISCPVTLPNVTGEYISCWPLGWVHHLLIQEHVSITNNSSITTIYVLHFLIFKWCDHNYAS